MSVQPDDALGQVQNVRVTVPAEARHGSYATLALVSHSGHGFTIDFCQVQPTGDDQDVPADVVSRVHLPPTLMPSLLRTLQANVAAYEGQFGSIRDVP
jgi:hypothetical protein